MMLLFLILALYTELVVSSKLPITLSLGRSITSEIHNIHIESTLATHSTITYTYGDCDSRTPKDAHHVVAKTEGELHHRLVWRLPQYTRSGGCISAWNEDDVLLGRSLPAQIAIKTRRSKRTVVPMDNSSHIDSEGPWFDGVALLNKTSITTIDVEVAKAKEIAIVGAGMAGLMTWLCLNESGMTNLTIVEGSDRFGGRVHTEYFGDPSDRLWQDMGAMRFPRSIIKPEMNLILPIQDQKLVFDLAAELNLLNGNDSQWSVNFAKWIEDSESGLQCQAPRKPDGSCPTLRDIAANSSYAVPQPPISAEAQELMGKITELAFDPASIKLIATNIFEAHKKWLDTGLGGLGGEQWSEFGYMHNYLKYSLNATDQVLNLLLAQTPKGGSLWTIVYQIAYFTATDWQTIDGGLSRLPNAFHPLVDHITMMDSRVNAIDYNETTSKVNLSWSTKTGSKETATFDYAITTVPFALMRMWRLPNFSITKNDAISSYGYESVCKVALKFKTRFWEHFEQPIYGGCSSTTDVKGIGSICYPSNDINSTGPGIMLASYTNADSGLRWASVPESEHVQYVVDAMASMHGHEIVQNQYTGDYRRKCWILDRFSTVSWGAATVGQRQLYIPEFFRTEKGVILAGEGTSYSSAWVSSALESGVRASIQLLLELGLVDEAKAVVEKWMARWILV